jgi:hypothetical protein
VYGINTIDNPALLGCAQAMYNGMEGDPATYVAPPPPLPALLVLIQNAFKAQQAVAMGTKGAAATRDVERNLLFTGMENERMYIQTLADANPARAVALIQNVGLRVAGTPLYAKALLTLRLGKLSGSVVCDANVGLLETLTVVKPTRSRYYNWQYTVDGGLTFITPTPTPTGKITLHGLTPLTMVGVRVNLHDAAGPGPWSQLVTILVR